ncbi:MAG: alpha-mannosidase [Clostridia bacterium]|nr:alpha-mannosidase [Clostridia bacterium]
MLHHTYNPRVLKNLIKQLPPYITERSFELNDWLSYEGVHTSPAVIELTGDEKTIMRLGDRWSATLDTTRYFEKEFTVPVEFEGRKIYLTVDFGGEAIVRINGKIMGAVSSREASGWVHRTDILFPDGLKGGERLFIQVENAVDSGGYFNHAFPDKKPITYTMNTAAFRIINEEAEDIWYDISCAYDVYENTEDEYAGKRVYNAVDLAIHKLDFDLGKERFYKSIPEAKKCLWDELNKINYSTPGEVIICGHSHLDVAWLWTVKEIHRKCARTFSNNAALMKAYPDFKFTQSQAAVYSFLKDHYPEVYETVKKYIKNGQWEITGNTWVEADTNLASGESLIRQLLYGREFFLKEFGISSDIYWLPDCFGFTAALPQVIKKSGMKYFLTSKLQYNDTNEFPLSVFKWRSHSGDEVISYMQKVHYEGDADARYIKNTRKTNRQNDLVDASMGMFGYGDGGGGCTFDMVEKVRRFQKIPGLPKVRMGQAGDFFAEIEKDEDKLPVWDGEMYYENHRGTFTSQAFVKKNNRRGEYMLRLAEMLSLLAGTYDRERIEKVWKLLLVNQFHDILPGTSIEEVFINTREEYALMNKEGNDIIDTALRLLSHKASTGKNSIIVWNFLPYTVSGFVKAEIPEGFSGVKDAYSVVNGNEVEFIAENVPAMGYKVFTLSKEIAERGTISAGNNFLENKYVRAEFDENGNLTAFINKKLNKNVLSSTGNLLSVSHDKPIHESAWNLENDYKMKMTYLTKAQKVELSECTPVKAVLKTVRRYESSVITQLITLYADSETLIFDTTVDWHEREKVLKAEFPLSIRSRIATGEIAHGALERLTYANNSYEKAMFEFCAHKWADLSQGDMGVSIINDCKYGYDVDNNVLRITLMRAPVLPDATADKGISTFRYGIYAHENGWNDSDTVKEAFKENIPLRAVYSDEANGTETERSFITLSDDRVMIDAIKPAQDNDGIIIRVYETNAHSGDVTMTLPCSGFKVRECNLMEVNGKELEATDNSFTFPITPFEVRTFRINGK